MARRRKITTVEAYKGDLGEYLKKYNYQPKLSNKLDNLGGAAFTQELINEIVLWR
ncbi:MAG: hypothetical protein HYY13_14105 [Nitrospirae bacterium]|nr:hypothetical protein [Nitrospirota bacterium]